MTLDCPEIVKIFPIVAVKHRIPSPTREAGDGMEASKPTQQNSDVKFSSPETKLIKLPRTNISVEKLPPISDDKVKLPVTEPTSPLVPIFAKNPHPSFQGAKKVKEAKFVPYEPYKAAITPLVTKTKKAKKSPKSPKAENLGSQEIQEESFESTPEFIQDPEKEKEIFALKKKLEETEKQLRIQTQVNTEVKKLLVASVGEDIEAKVDFLTQDKARLAADIRQYSSKISRDFEEKEKLSVESHLWKSKFLASSVIVDELARWKGVLLQRNEDCDHFIRLLLHERKLLWNSMSTTHEILERLKIAFDPLNTMENSNRSQIEAASILGLADLSTLTVQDLRNRLLGTTQLKTYESKNVILPKLLDTPAEEGLKSLLNNPATNLETSNLSDLATTALTGAAKPHLKKLSDQSASSRNDFKCCTHCQGSIHVV